MLTMHVSSVIYLKEAFVKYIYTENIKKNQIYATQVMFFSVFRMNLAN